MTPLPADYRDWMQTEGSKESITAFAPTFDTLRASFPNGDAFFKLASRSPKDSWAMISDDYDRAGVQPHNASSEKVAEAFLHSERIWTDLFDSEAADYTPMICAREWIPGAEPHREFRCFMRDRKLVGVTVYRAWDEESKPEIVADPARWHDAIVAWFPTFLDAVHVDNVVFDVMVLDNRIVLLELNPDLGSTYPGHFLDKEFDGRFRYLGDGDSEVV